MSFGLPIGSRQQKHPLWLLLLGAVLIFIPAFLLLRAREGHTTEPSPAKPLSAAEFRGRGLPYYGDGELPAALAHYARGELGEAGKLLEAARSDPSQPARIPEALYYLGRIAIESGRRADGEKLLLELTNDHARSKYAGDAYGYFAKLARDAGDQDKLRKLYERIAERYPGSTAAVEALRQLAALAEKRGDLEAALKSYSGLLRCPLPAEERGRALARAEELSRKVVYSPRRTRGARYHTVKQGDTLGKLAKQYKVSAGFLRLLNNKSNNTIYINEQLKVLDGDFLVVVRKGLYELLLFFDGMLVKRYAVGLGKEDRTPVGRFKIVTKLKHPVWYWQGRRIPAGDPRNLLGTRWLGFDNQPGASGFGIHGTLDQASIGKNLSNGCVRMRNEQVEELFELVPYGTRVEISG